jgi:argininosuccinate lyase
VLNLKMPFRNAHHVAGRIVALAERKGVRLEELDLADLKAVESGITRDVFAVLSIENSVKSRSSYGGTAPQNVRKMARGWIKRLARQAAAG